jgi:hypothetical protein
MYAKVVILFVIRVRFGDRLAMDCIGEKQPSMGNTAWEAYRDRLNTA